METGLYIHIPFCRRRCRYCDFVSYAGREQEAERYLFALEREMASRPSPRPVTSVFIGGGTPTTLTEAQLAFLLKIIPRYYALTPEAEFTVECNPGTASREKLRVLAYGGVNRLSLGLQSTDDGLLAAVGRIHTYRDFLATLDAALAVGLTNLNADLMVGLPGQTVDVARQTAVTVAALPLTHVSAYSLILEEGTPLYDDVRNGRVRLPDEDETADMSDAVTETLTAAGLIRYEVSNYARPGFSCRHNQLYWRRGDYIGLGAGAVSLSGDLRRENTPSLDDYIASRKHTDTVVSEEDARFETIMLALRTAEGLDMEAFGRRFSLSETITAAIEKNLSRGNLIREGNVLRATRRGLDILNTVLEDFLE